MSYKNILRHHFEKDKLRNEIRGQPLQYTPLRWIMKISAIQDTTLKSTRFFQVIVTKNINYYNIGLWEII